MENVLADAKANIIKEFVEQNPSGSPSGPAEIEGQVTSLPQTLDASTCFTALAAPSMEGKTQFAFALRKVKPLYFPMSEAQRSLRHKPQSIYTNFTNLAKVLFHSAHYDLRTLDNASLAKEIQNSLSPLFVVGFLLKLVELSQGCPCDENWMDFHAQRGNFSFKPVPLSKAVGKFDGYVLVLDEFFACLENTLIRNLARTLGLHCIVMNTNTKVANIVGKETSSAGTSNSIWSLVVTKLGPAFKDVLNSEYGLIESIEKLLVTAPTNHPIRTFLTGFYEHDLQNLRPGVAEFVAKILKARADSGFVVSSETSFGAFLDGVVRDLESAFARRKASLLDESAMLGHIALLLPESYGVAVNEVAEVPVVIEDADVIAAEDDDAEQEFTSNAAEAVIAAVEVSNTDVVIKASEAWNHARFIEKHLFYLRSPADSARSQSPWFLTFPPTNEKGPLRVFKSLKPAAQEVNPSNFNIAPEDWRLHHSEFNPKEFFTVAACFFIPFVNSVARLMLHAGELIRNCTASVSTSKNVNASSLDGNSFEVTAAVCVVKATHYTMSATGPSFSFKAKNGIEFIRNVIHEMSYSYDPWRAPIEYPLELRELLGRIEIPFLYSISFENPAFEALAAIEFDSNLFVSNYERTSNASQIDGKFDGRIGEEYVTVCCECKNRAKVISSSELLKILIKSAMHNAKLSLVFCTEFASIAKPTAKFQVYCRKFKVNVFRVALAKVDGQYQIIPFTQDFIIHEKPSTTCIVLETVRIK